MSYQFHIACTAEEGAAVALRQSGEHQYLNIALDDGASATLRIGQRKNLRLCVYPTAASTERAYRAFTPADAGAHTEWIPGPELGGGHWLHTFQLASLLEWAQAAGQTMLRDIAAGRLRTDRMDDCVEPRLHTSAEVATELGISQRRVRALATRRGLGRVLAGSLVLTSADIAAMQERTPGRPRAK